MNNIRPLNFLL